MNRSAQTLEWLRQFESRNITFMERDGSWPIVWERARGGHVWDAEGRRYLDLTAAFGVAAAGHANPRVVRAGRRQMGRLLHAMGDVHPHVLKAKLARELSRITFERWNATGKTIFCNSGFEAVEAALKTAMLATGKPGVIAFKGAYHGLGYGSLNVTQRGHFRSGFVRQLKEFGCFLPFPSEAEQLHLLQRALRKILRRGRVGAVLVEPVQGRAGIHVPPAGFMEVLRSACAEFGALLILDEIFTGFGRTGKWFACEHSGVTPDLVCLGKAMTGGFPMSACVGRAELMDAAWPASTGEAIHTSTFLGHPVGCAMALAQIQELESRHLPERSARLGTILLELLKGLKPPKKLQFTARGLGLMAGLEMRLPSGKPASTACLCLIKHMLHAGFILLPEGEHAHVVSFTPPLTISEKQLRDTVAVLEEQLAGL